MVALADRFVREAKAQQNRTAGNSRRPKNAYPRFFVQPKHRGPAQNIGLLSQKYLDQETGWLYYGFRYYSPELGRWPSRDPIGEQGGLNLYAALRNAPACLVDAYGLSVDLHVEHAYGSWYDKSSYHGSVEWHHGANSGTVIYTDYSGPGDYGGADANIDTGYTISGGDLSVWQLGGTMIQGLGWYRRSRVDYLQMSAFLYGKFVICGCCDSGEITMSWNSSAGASASGTWSGGFASDVVFNGNSIAAGLALSGGSSATDSDSGVDTAVLNPSDYAADSSKCTWIDFSLSIGGNDHDTTGSGAAWNANLQVSVECKE